MTWFVLLIVASVLLLAGFVVGLVFVVLFIVKSLGGTTGGHWRLQPQGVQPRGQPLAGEFQRVPPRGDQQLAGFFPFQAVNPSASLGRLC